MLRAVGIEVWFDQDEQQLSRSLDIQPPTFESYLRAMFQFHKETTRGYQQGIAILTHEHLADTRELSWARGYSFATTGQEDKAREIIADIEHVQDNGLPLALLYASVGNAEQGLYRAEQLREIRMPWYPWLVGWFPQFRAFHNHPLVIARAKELGVPLLDGPT